MTLSPSQALFREVPASDQILSADQILDLVRGVGFEVGIALYAVNWGALAVLPSTGETFAARAFGTDEKAKRDCAVQLAQLVGINLR